MRGGKGRFKREKSNRRRCGMVHARGKNKRRNRKEIRRTNSEEKKESGGSKGRWCRVGVWDEESLASSLSPGGLLEGHVGCGVCFSSQSTSDVIVRVAKGVQGRSRLVAQVP